MLSLAGSPDLERPPFLIQVLVGAVPLSAASIYLDEDGSVFDIWQQGMSAGNVSKMSQLRHLMIKALIRDEWTAIVLYKMNRSPDCRRQIFPVSEGNLSVILVIEDDPRIQKALHRQFTTEGYEVHVADDGAKGLSTCKTLKPTGVVLDLMLPGMSGAEVCKGIKSWSASTPVVVLSAVSEVADKVLLLELGADDYVTKPFSPRELMARVQAAIRRTQPRTPSTQFRFGSIAADFSAMEVFKDDLPVILTAYEIKLLRYFVEHPDRVITREELLNEVWNYTSYPTTRTVDNHIFKLRQKLEVDPTNPIYFRTIHGMGYKFVRGT